MKNITLLTVGILTSFFLPGCLWMKPKPQLAPIEKLYLTSPGSGTVTANFCLDDALAAKQKLKILFLIDKSSSNQNPPEASDPDGFKRYSALMDLLNSAQPDPNTYFGYINFSSGIGNIQEFTNDLPLMRRKIRDEWTGNGTVNLPRPQDFGETDYLGALGAARTEIERDLQDVVAGNQDQTTTSRYLVVLVSDGYPTVGGVAQTSAQLEQAILPTTSTSLLSLKNITQYKKYVDDIILHTGYYHSGTLVDPDARDILQSMARWGNGDFHVFGAGVAIDYALFAVPMRHVLHHLADVIVENLSTVWEADGTLQLDSDGDGLSDRMEDLLGSNKYLADSDGNGVSDYVEYRTKGKPCRDSHCSSATTARDNYVGCQGMIASTQGTTLFFNDMDGDGLNDCEEWILRSDPSSFDSNNDRVPDGVAFRHGIQFIAGASDAHADPDNDGSSNLREIKEGTPLQKQNDSVPGLIPAVYTMIQTDPVKQCYRLDVTDLATLGINNIIRISVIENLAVVENRSVLHSAVAPLEQKSNHVDFPIGSIK